MAISWNEIKDRALKFSIEWAEESKERAEKDSFWNDFFNVFGISRRRVATFEEPVKKLNDRQGFIDLFWKGTLLVEHKSKGKNLDAAFEQATDYFHGIKEHTRNPPNMKKVLLLILFLSIINSAHAQFSENNALYSGLEFNVGNYVGVDLSLNYVYKETYSLRFGYSSNTRRAKSKPADYSQGLISALFLGAGNPRDRLENYQFAVGKIYNLNDKGTKRINLSLGIGYTIINEPVNWRNTEGGSIGRNYSWDYHEFNTWSLIINPKIEYPFSRAYGLTISPMLQINKHSTYIGVGFGQMLGVLKKKKRIENSSNQEN